MWIKKDQLSDLQELFSTKAVVGNKRIYIIKNSDRMNNFSANSIPDRLASFFAISISVKLPRSRMYCARRSDGIFESDSRSSGRRASLNSAFTFSRNMSSVSNIAIAGWSVGLLCCLCGGQFAFAVSAAGYRYRTNCVRILRPALSMAQFAFCTPSGSGFPFNAKRY